MNAIQMVTRPEEVDNKIDSGKSQTGKLFNRTSQASTSIVIISLLIFALCIYRYNSSCESFAKHGWWLGGIILIVLGAIYISSGVGWYYLLSQMGEDRLSDLFGIANRLLPPGAFQKGPMACLPVA